MLGTGAKRRVLPIATNAATFKAGDCSGMPVLLDVKVVVATVRAVSSVGDDFGEVDPVSEVRVFGTIKGKIPTFTQDRCRVGGIVGIVPVD